jgi:N-acetyl-anhydromuramyl-L-alanine amidase AmpD
MINYISKVNDNKLSSARPEGSVINTITITYSSCDGDFNQALTTMASRGTSIHYTIKSDGFLDQHHSETQKAFYAGASHWHGEYGVNNYAIGIMLINDAKSSFPEEQTNKLIALINDIQERHNMTMEVVGLAEVNAKHVAPGVFMPWDKLAEAGIGKSVKFPEDIDRACKISLDDKGDHVLALQEKLQEHGYQVPQTGEYDEVTAKFAQSFSNRYAPQDTHDSEDNFSNNIICWSNAADYALNELSGLNSDEAIPTSSDEL